MTQKKSDHTAVPRKQRGKFSPQFKQQAVERAKVDGVAKVAKDLGISESMLYLWRKNSEQTGIPFEDKKIQSAELARLKRENAQLQQENAFLKKVATYFAKDDERGTK